LQMIRQGKTSTPSAAFPAGSCLLDTNYISCFHSRPCTCQRHTLRTRLRWGLCSPQSRYNCSGRHLSAVPRSAPRTDCTPKRPLSHKYQQGTASMGHRPRAPCTCLDGRPRTRRHPRRCSPCCTCSLTVCCSGRAKTSGKGSLSMQSTLHLACICLPRKGHTVRRRGP